MLTSELQATGEAENQAEVKNQDTTLAKLDAALAEHAAALAKARAIEQPRIELADAIRISVKFSSST